MKTKNGSHEKVFQLAYSHFKTKVDTLTGIEKLKQPTLGLEGWMRVELAKALENEDLLIRITNRQADLKLKNGYELELKAGAGFDLYFIKEGLKWGHPCLFLAYTPKSIAEIKNKLEENPQVRAEIKSLKNNWIIGLLYNV